MRTFIALEISDTIREAIAQLISHLTYSGADVKWVAPENIHLTIKFLGEVSEEKLPALQQALDDIGSRTLPFMWTIKNIGAFPRLDYPRIIWVGLEKGAPEATALAKAVDEECVKRGFAKEERPFAVHITIGRVRSPKNREALKEKIATFAFTSAALAPQPMNAITLFQSTLTPHGSIYTKLHESALAPRR